MQAVLNKFKQNQVLYVNVLFTFFCLMFSLSAGVKVAWLSMWLIVPLCMSTTNAFSCLIYMSLYMRVLPNLKLFATIIFISFFIILIKKIFYLNKNKLLNKYLKMLLFYTMLIIFPLFYSIIFNKTINIALIYYFNMINLLFLFYLLKNELNFKIILIYCYGILISSLLALLTYYGGLYKYAFDAGNRFCAFAPLCNTLGASCIIGINAVYVLFVNKKINGKLATFLMSILTLIGVGTLSKNFLITLVISLCVIFTSQLKRSNNKKRFLSVCLITTLAISPFVLYYGGIMMDRFFADKSYSNIVDTITTGRLDKWLIYLRPWSKYLYSIIFGLGICFDYNTPWSSHSLYVGYLSRLGIVGIVVLGVFIYSIIFKNQTSKLSLRYLPIIIVAIICLAEDMSHNTFNFVPFIMALITLTADNKHQ